MGWFSVFQFLATNLRKRPFTQSLHFDGRHLTSATGLTFPFAERGHYEVGTVDRGRTEATHSRCSCASCKLGRGRATRQSDRTAGRHPDCCVAPHRQVTSRRDESAGSGCRTDRGRLIPAHRASRTSSPAPVRQRRDPRGPDSRHTRAVGCWQVNVRSHTP